MGNFVVSARKYRPQKFSEVVGQESITTTLQNALKTDHLAHAFLFCGPRGVGKTTCARILARTLNCENVQNEVDPCGECSSCKSFNKNASFNIFELDAASHNSVDDIRDLNEQVRFAPQQGKYKVYIIDEVHMLSTSAFNAFLKTLEEPPAHAIFILATTEKQKILPTILSRCQIFDFKRIQVKDTVRHLEQICKQEGVEAETDALTVIAQKSDGALRDALSLFDRLASLEGKKITYRSVVANLNLLDYDVFFKTADACLREDVRDVLLILDKVLNDGFEGDSFLNGLATHFRDLLVCQDPRTIHLQDHSETLKQRYLDQAALMSTSYIFSALNLINQTDITYPQAQNKRLHVEMALSKVCFLNRATTIAPFRAEKKTANQTGAIKKVTDPTPLPHRDAAPQGAASNQKSSIDIPGGDKVESNIEPDVTLGPDVQVESNPTTEAEAPGNSDGNSPSNSLEPIEATIDPEVKTGHDTGGDQDKATVAETKSTTTKTNTPANSDQQPETSQIPSRNGKPEISTPALSLDIPQLGDISEIQKKVISEEETARANSLELSVENLEKWWIGRQEGLNSQSAVSTFKQTRISLEDKTVVLEVNSPLAKDRILEAVDLLPVLRKEFHERMLLIEFKVIEDENFQANQVKKPLTNKEKYALLVKKNPQLQQLRDILDLTVDND